MNAITSLSNPDKSAHRKQSRKAYFAALRYAGHVITHPFDGFWDLAHEHKGNAWAATTFLALFLLTYVLKLMYTSFQFITAPIQYINVFERAASLLLPFLVLCFANWALTTLFDGKGRFKDIYIAMCYALVPYVLLQLPLILISNIITFDEASFYTVLMSFSLIWCGALAFIGLMQVHDYSPGKTIIFIIATILGSAVVIFIVLVFFSLLSDAVGFFVSLYREIAFRLN